MPFTGDAEHPHKPSLRPVSNFLVYATLAGRVKKQRI